MQAVHEFIYSATPCFHYNKDFSMGVSLVPVVLSKASRGHGSTESILVYLSRQMEHAVETLNNFSRSRQLVTSNYQY